jgi:hypothetical protein
MYLIRNAQAHALYIVHVQGDTYGDREVQRVKKVEFMLIQIENGAFFLNSEVYCLLLTI